jgi:CheY-specific phosphatase CheX
MRRSASEIIRGLEIRIARLEYKKSSKQSNLKMSVGVTGYSRGGILEKWTFSEMIKYVNSKIRSAQEILKNAILDEPRDFDSSEEIHINISNGLSFNDGLFAISWREDGGTDIFSGLM